MTALGTGPPLKSRLQDAIHQFGNAARAFCEMFTQALRGAMLIKLAFQELVAPVLAQALLIVTRLREAACMTIGKSARGIAIEPAEPFQR